MVSSIPTQQHMNLVMHAWSVGWPCSLGMWSARASVPGICYWVCWLKPHLVRDFRNFVEKRGIIIEPHQSCSRNFLEWIHMDPFSGGQNWLHLQLILDDFYAYYAEFHGVWPCSLQISSQRKQGRCFWAMWIWTMLENLLHDMIVDIHAVYDILS